ncbi:endosomal transmembrane epsin interactor 1 isoform X4 [Vidua chalybeata]|uniref:endosomal transmembrane epsin interactor 1 isoform X4 n=1 Tax=Vidua chalybeata TaxID=81927 RepID=UPI0023A86441|nr:endosomal transmembrane epsin interactor 1 isoform X4 [Vidua chalybeata]
MVLPGSCCSLPGFVPLPQAGPLRPAAPPRRRPCPLLLFRSLFGLALLQTGLGCALMALCFGALSLSSAPQVKNACPLWAGSSAVLCGILGLTTWKRPMRLLVNLFVLLSVISFMLNVTGLILGCQGIQFVSRVPRCNLMDKYENKTCFCCEELHPTTCTEAEAVLKLYHVNTCSAAHLLLKKVLLALSALNALTATVCFTAAALHYLLTLASRRSCTDECEIEDEDHNFDSDDFVPPVPPPSYFATFNSYTPQTGHSTPVSDVISLHYTYVIPIRGAEVYCPLDPPPPYETVCSLKSSEQGGALQINGVEEVDSGEVSDRQSFQGTVLNSETATLDVNPLNAVTLRKSSRAKASWGRPQSLIDYKSYMDTKQRVAWILEQSCSMSPDIHDLVENIKSVLKSDEKHMAEVVASATFLEQVMIPVQQATSLKAHVLPSRLHPGLLYLESCGDLSTFITEGEQLAERRIQRAEHERPHSVIGVLRETVL